MEALRIAIEDLVAGLSAGSQSAGAFPPSTRRLAGTRGRSDAGTWGVQVDANANGTVTMSGVVVTDPASGGLTNAAGVASNIIRGSGDVGW